MQSSWRSTFIALALISVVAACGVHEDRVVEVSADDPEMTLAISKARQTLPEFWKVFESRTNGESDFSLKVRVEDRNGTEHFWTTNIRRDGETLRGEINNDANIVKSVKLGDEVQFRQDDISDWLYIRDGKMFGNFTIRPLLKSMSEEDAKHFKGLLAEP